MTDAPLLERADQQHAIDRALRDARQRAGHVLAIEGAPGIGKSRLLAELRRTAASSQRVLAARASELERGFAFGVVRQLFEAVVRDPELREVALDGAAASAASVFDDAPTEGGAASFALLHGLHWLTLNLADDGPLVLAIDDLHWCDTSSLRFLGYLARRLDGTDILLACATRPVSPASPDAQLLGDLLDQPGVVHLFPQALSPAATRTLLEEQLGRPVDAAFARACFDATDGNPLMLRQLGRSLEAEGIAPVADEAESVRRAARRALSRTVLARVGRRSAEAVQLARAVATLGDGATPDLVAALAGIAPAAIDAAWRELVEAEVLRQDSLAFVHALVRDAIYLDLPEPSRSRLHLEAAKALERTGASVERIAGQLQLAPCQGDPWVADIALRAGVAALGHGAPDAAVTHLRRALAEPIAESERIRVLEPLAAALFDVDATAGVEVIAELAALVDDPHARTELQIARVQLLALTDRWDEAAELCRELEAALGEEHAGQRASLEAIRSVCVIFGARDPAGYLGLEHARNDRPGGSVGERMRAGQAALMWMYDGATAQEAGDLAGGAIADDPTLLRDHTLVAVAPLYLLALADRESSMDLWDRAQADAHRSGSVILNVTISLWLGVIRWRRGDLSGAISQLADSLAFAGRWGTGLEARRYATTSLALAYVDHGDIAEGRRYLDSIAPLEGAASLSTLLWLHSDAWLLIAEGRFREAVDAADLLEQRAGRWVRQPIGFDWHLPRAIALHRLGRVDEAIAQAQAGVAIARHWGAPGVVGPALRVLGEVKGADGLAELAESVDVLGRSPAKHQLARSLITYGAALRRAGQVTEAREPLERALDLAVACGSPMLADMARTELAASGVRRRPSDLAGADALTPSERRVADLAAGGRTNREIAQELFVTPKTVEVHLSAAYRKLGIGSRRELGAALAPA